MEMLHPYETHMPHRPVCPGDDRSIIWEDIALHSHRWSHINLTTKGPMIALQNFTCYSPLLRNLRSVMLDVSSPTDICRLFSSAPLLQDLAFCGSITLWRELARTIPLHQLVNLMVTVRIYEPDDANPDFYACLKEAALLEGLHFNVARIVPRPSTPSDVPLSLAFIHTHIHRLTLNGEIPSVLDQCSMPNLKELFVYSEYRPYVGGLLEIDPADIKRLVRFVSRSECSVRTFSCFRPMPLSTFKAFGRSGRRRRRH
ncbi:uncharacterized protein EV420DRAFT_1029490 [Desarmillaria tabescens]|uniref:Uncharacterized protein n=1 Tax=Armillaria tabescens TaxID=1929756 RepID=A0AA39JJ25_ARMTA|nr:uncharacterized protein EV420DRAFT_1029490 [Desarmillaria tabescens]KAK0443384.1 hypothetical protein EV420DRAFT_1029490 [Desarmillaria tabescens]